MRVALFALLVAAAGCEPEIGQPCDPNEAEVLDKVKIADGSGSDLVRDVSFDTCSTALCASTDGSRPYCTKQCESDIECAEAGDGFSCQQIVQFGILACQDFTPADECDDDGFPCDCLDADGQPSDQPLKYCAASPAVIDARDVEFGRPKFKAP